MRKVIALIVWTGLACTGPLTEVPLVPQPGGQGPAPASALVTDCFDWPTREFTKANHADVGVRLTTGDRAVDFTLRDTRGNAVRLADKLADKPVLLVQGSATCPRFQGGRLGLEETVKRHRNDVTVLLAYNIEAHPAGNDPSPYKGKPNPQEFSTRGQPKSYEERLKNAKEIARDSSMPVMVDDYQSPGSNPVWCTYGTCAFCSWLIRQDGTIAAHHEWHDAESMEGSIQALLAEAR